VDTNSIITTFAGNGLNSITGDGRAPTLAGIGLPVDVAFDAVENMYIADHGAAPAAPTSFTLDGSGSGPAIVVAVPMSGDAHLVNTLNLLTAATPLLSIAPASAASTVRSMPVTPRRSRRWLPHLTRFLLP
jgi:hypothetical protein